MTVMNNYSRPQRWMFGAIVLVALALHVGLFIAFKPWDPVVAHERVVVSDARGYHDLALKLLHTRSFDDFGAFRTPAYPLFVAAIYAVVGAKPWVVLLVQIFISVGTGILVSAIAHRVTGSLQSAFITLVLAALNPLFPVMALQLMSETLFTFILAAALLVCIMAFEMRQSRRFAIAGVLLGLTALVRPVSWYLPWVVAPFILLQPKNARTNNVKHTFIFLGVFFLTLFPWQVRNYRTYRAYALATVADYNLLEYNAARVKSIIEEVSLDQAREELNQSVASTEHNPFARARAQKRAALSYIAQHPVTYAWYHIKGGVNMFVGTVKGELLIMAGRAPAHSASSVTAERLSERVARVVFNLKHEFYLTPLLLFQLLIEYTGFVVGAIALFVKKKGWLAAFFLSIVLYFFLTVGLVGSSRFRHPVMTAYFPVSAYGLWIIVRQIYMRLCRGKPRTPLGLTPFRTRSNGAHAHGVDQHLPSGLITIHL